MNNGGINKHNPYKEPGEPEHTFTVPEDSWQCQSCFGYNQNGTEKCYICGAGINDEGIMF